MDTNEAQTQSHSPRIPENQSILNVAVKINNKEVMEAEKTEERNRRHFLRALCKLKLWGPGESPPAGAASLGWEEKHKGRGLISPGSQEEPHWPASLPEAPGKCPLTSAQRVLFLNPTHLLSSSKAP